jgi:hypothetical protein
VLLTFRPIKTWPDGWQDPNRNRLTNPFKATYSDTLNLLEREARAVNTISATLQVDASDRDCRLDGQLRANARVGHPGVILTLETKSLGTLVYACDRFLAVSYRRHLDAWQVNLRAIALGMEALRKVDRYGIAERGQQYAGYRELGAGTPLGPGKMTVEAAARFLIEHGEWGGEPADVDMIITAAGDTTGPGPDVLRGYFRHAAKKLHPDAGGDPALFARLKEAMELLGGAA